MCSPATGLRVTIFPSSLVPHAELVDFFVHEGAVDVVFYIAACHMHTSPPVMEELSRVLALSCSIGTSPCLCFTFVFVCFCLCMCVCLCVLCLCVLVRRAHDERTK